MSYQTPSINTRARFTICGIRVVPVKYTIRPFEYIIFSQSNTPFGRAVIPDIVPMVTSRCLIMNVVPVYRAYIQSKSCTGAYPEPAFAVSVVSTRVVPAQGRVNTFMAVLPLFVYTNSDAEYRAIYELGLLHDTPVPVKVVVTVDPHELIR